MIKKILSIIANIIPAILAIIIVIELFLKNYSSILTTVIIGMSISVLVFLSWAIVTLIEKRKSKTKIAVAKTDWRFKTTAGLFKTNASEGITTVFFSEEKKLFDKFVKEYDDGSLTFPKVNYRKSAEITCSFGLSLGYTRNEKGGITLGCARIHGGVDRANGQSVAGVPDVVMSPFNFQRSAIIDYGNYLYGTLIQLFQDEYQFEFRVGHMNPKGDIIPWSLEQFRKHRPFSRDWMLGKAGTYGDSTGAHTHSEIASYDEKCEVLEILLEELYKDDIYREYSTEDVLKGYRSLTNYKTTSDKICLDNWMQLKMQRRVFFINKYMIRYIDGNNKNRTLYSTSLLFDGL